jgi:hypothetical protein
MINIDSRVALYLFVEPCDMRRQMDSLLGVVNHELVEAATSGKRWAARCEKDSQRPHGPAPISWSVKKNVLPTFPYAWLVRSIHS